MILKFFKSITNKKLPETNLEEKNWWSRPWIDSKDKHTIKYMEEIPYQELE